MLVMALICTFGSMLKAEVVYTDSKVRFTLIDEGTVRMEYAPDGKFVDNKSFVAVQREFPKVAATVKNSGSQLVVTTSKMVLTYRKGSGAFDAKNLSIKSVKGAKVPFTWVPGTKQKGNLKGTYRTLDGYDGDSYAYSSAREKIPLEDGILATDGWTLIDDSKSLLFDGSEDWDWVTERTSAEGSQDWLFLAYGHDYKGALQSYTKFAGRMPLPPRYAFGYWWSRYWSYSDKDFRDLIANFKRYDIPLDVLVIDMDWHPISEAAGGGWTGWDWNENLFPDYKKFLKFLDDEGVKATMNLHPASGVRPFEKKYDEFIKRAGIAKGESTEWLGSNKAYAKAIFDTYLHPYMDEGVDFWWLDWQQWLNDKKIKSLSNVYWCNYMFFTDMERYGNKRPMLYHRWGGLGNHRYQVGFSGDAFITWESLDFLPYFNSTASNVMYGYWSHDIGGHQSRTFGTPVKPQLYTRAMQMGQYLPIIRSHSTKDACLNKEPWSFEPKTQQRLVDVIKGRYALVPYIYTMAREAYETSISLCRPLYYDYPEAKEAYDFKNEYMFGDNMLIAPVTAPVDSTGYARLKVWLPEGEWLEYATGTMLKGNQTLDRSFTMDEYPVYVKAGSIIPYYTNAKNLSGNDQAVTVRVFPGADKGEFTLYEDNGEDREYAATYATTKLSYSRSGNSLRVEIGARKGQYADMPAQRCYSLALPCQAAPSSVKVNGKSAEFTYDGYNLEATVCLGDIDCAAGAVVEVQTTDELNLADGTKARFARVSNAVATYKNAPGTSWGGSNAQMVYTPAMAFLEAAPMRLNYHPEKQVETIRQFNEYYANLGEVVLEQVGNPQWFNRFVQLLDESSLQLNDVMGLISTDKGTGLDIKYYNNRNMEGQPVATEHVTTLNRGYGGSPYTGVKEDDWSQVVTGQLVPEKDGKLLLTLSGDDGYRLFVNGKELMGDWGNHSETTRKKTIDVKAGQKYDIRIEHYDDRASASLRLSAVMMPQQ